jgi:hypothetical protein
MKPRVRAQLHSSSGRSSKILKDHTHIETVVEVAGVGRLVLDVDSGGGSSLRAHPEGSEDRSRDLLAVGVVHAEGIVAIHPEELSAVDGEQGAPRPSEVPMCEASILLLPYSPECVEGAFCEVRLDGVLGSSPPLVPSNQQRSSF